MKKTFFISFFILGVTSIIAQLTIIREVIISFYGNEIFVGLVLGFWLIWVGVGSIVLGGILSSKKSLPILISCHFFIPWFLGLAIILIRLARPVLAPTSQLPDFLLSLGYLLIVMAPLCLIFGLQFAVASRALVLVNETKAGFFKKIIGWLKKKISFSKNYKHQSFGQSWLFSRNFRLSWWRFNLLFCFDFLG